MFLLNHLLMVLNTKQPVFGDIFDDLHSMNKSIFPNSVTNIYKYLFIVVIIADIAVAATVVTVQGSFCSTIFRL